MSYGGAFALQEAIYAALTGAPAVTALVGGNIFDAPAHADAPDGTVGPYVTIGDERVEDWSARGLRGAMHDVEISVHAAEAGFADAKRIAAAVSETLEAGLPALSAGRVATNSFRGARTRRLRDGRRRIDLRFRFRIEL